MRQKWCDFFRTRRTGTTLRFRWVSRWFQLAGVDGGLHGAAQTRRAGAAHGDYERTAWRKTRPSKRRGDSAMVFRFRRSLATTVCRATREVTRLLGPGTQRSPDGNQLAEMISVVVGDQQRFAQ